MHPLLLRQIEQALLDLSACPAAVAAVLQLVSETYQAFDDEKTVCREMERLDHIIEFLPDAIFAVDNEHRVIAWNKAMAVMTGVPKQEILGTGASNTPSPSTATPAPFCWISSPRIPVRATPCTVRSRLRTRPGPRRCSSRPCTEGGGFCVDQGQPPV